jgi:hypothetical protein
MAAPTLRPIVQMKTTVIEKFRAVFSRDPEVIARAPGRIEVIGNQTDYSAGKLRLSLASNANHPRRQATARRSAPALKRTVFIARIFIGCLVCGL